MLHKYCIPGNNSVHNIIARTSALTPVGGLSMGLEHCPVWELKHKSKSSKDAFWVYEAVDQIAEAGLKLSVTMCAPNLVQWVYNFLSIHYNGLQYFQPLLFDSRISEVNLYCAENGVLKSLCPLSKRTHQKMKITSLWLQDIIDHLQLLTSVQHEKGQEFIHCNRGCMYMHVTKAK